jgi:transmembrane sensor
MSTKVHRFESKQRIREEAREWVLRLNQDAEPSATDIQELKKWASQSAEHKKQLKQAEAIWCDADLLSALNVKSDREQSKAKKRAHLKYAVGIAAVIALLFVPGLGLFPSQGVSHKASYSTMIGEIKVVELLDGSTVHLDTQTRIDVDYAKATRVVRLIKGKAFFDVAKDPDRPFEVDTEYGKVTALGTAFTVHLNEANIMVTVEEGLVELSSTLVRKATELPQLSKADSAKNRQIAPPSKVSLAQGGQSTFAQHEKHRQYLIPSDIARNLAWTRGILIFTGEDLESVVNEISRYTKVKIDIVNPELRTLSIGGRFETGELEALLDVLQVGFGVDVSFIDSELIELR